MTGIRVGANVIRLLDVAMRYPVAKRYRELLLHPLRPRATVLALRKIDLVIERGESLGVLGPNGAGKTTLLKLIGGILYPSRGHVLIDDRDTASDPQYTRRRVGLVVNEERSFYWRLSGIQNLEFFGVLDNLSGATLKRRVHELLEQVGLESDGDKLVAVYSSGMKQRLAIARGLLVDPDVLLLDEPTRSLDPTGANDIRDLLRAQVHSDRRRTLVVMTNAIGDVTGLCDRVCLISRGTITGSTSVPGKTQSDIEAFYRSNTETVQ